MQNLLGQCWLYSGSNVWTTAFEQKYIFQCYRCNISFLSFIFSTNYQHYFEKKKKKHHVRFWQLTQFIALIFKWLKKDFTSNFNITCLNIYSLLKKDYTCSIPVSGFRTSLKWKLAIILTNLVVNSCNNTENGLTPCAKKDRHSFEVLKTRFVNFSVCKIAYFNNCSNTWFVNNSNHANKIYWITGKSSC